MAQFARPDGDITNTGNNGFAAIDEATASDADFWYGDNNQADELEVSLSNVTDPLLSTGHIVRWRGAKVNAGTVDGTGNAVSITMRLLQGTTQIASETRAVDGGWVTNELTLTGAEADAITDYTDLRLEFVTTASGGSPANRRGGAVSWAELQIPDASTVYTDSNTTPLIFTPSATETTQYPDSGTVPLLLTPNATEVYTPGSIEHSDSATLYLNTRPRTWVLEAHIPGGGFTFAEAKLPQEQCTAGPFKAPNGSFYTPLLMGGEDRENILQVFKASDPNTSWSPAGPLNYYTAGGVSAGVYSILDGDLIHIAYGSHSGHFYYSVFDTSTDTWSIQKELITPAPISDALNLVGVGLGLRQNSEVIVGLSWAPEIGFSTAAYAIRSSGGVWGAVQNLSSVGVTAYGGPIIVGASDKAYLTYIDHSTLEAKMRELPSNNVLGTEILVATGLSDQLLGNAFLYDTDQIALLYHQDSGPLRVAKWTDEAAPGPSSQTISTANVAYQDGPLASLASYEATLHAIWVEDLIYDVYYDTDKSGAWGTDIELQDAVTAHKISNNVYRNGDVVLGYLWVNSGVVTYDEVVIVPVDTGTLSLVLTPSGTDGRISSDTDTSLLLLSPSAIEERISSDSDTTSLLFTPNASETHSVGGTEHVDSDTILLLFTPSSTDVAEFTDSDTESFIFTVSGLEERTSSDADTAALLFSPSSTDTFEAVDSDTVLLGMVASGIDGQVRTDSDTAVLLFTPAASDTQEATDTDTAVVVLEASGTEIFEAVEVETAILTFNPGGSDTYVPSGGAEYIDSGLVPLLFTVDGSDLRTQFDTNTVTLAFAPAGSDITQFADAAIANLTLAPSGLDAVTTIDFSMAPLLLQPNTVEVFDSEDADTALIQLTSSSSDILASTDSSTVPLALQPSVSDVIIVVDLGEIVLTLIPAGSDIWFSGSNVDYGTAILVLTPITIQEVRYLFDVLLVGTLNRRWSMVVQRRWSTPLVTSKWSAIVLNRKWSGVLESRIWAATMLQNRLWSAVFAGKRWIATYRGRGEL